ncbi:MAG: hypothetical protein RH982_14300 [Parvibaculum sp.]
MQRKIIRGAAWCDLVVTAPFAVPFIAEAVIALLYGIDREVGFATPGFMFEMSPLAMMFVHIMGVLGVVWAIVRLRQPVVELARMDASARLVVAALILYAILAGATPVLWLFVFTEIAGSIAQFAVMKRSAAQ